MSKKKYEAICKKAEKLEKLKRPSKQQEAKLLLYWFEMDKYKRRINEGKSDNINR